MADAPPVTFASLDDGSAPASATTAVEVCVAILRAAASARVTPGASLAVVEPSGAGAWVGVGQLSYGGPAVEPATRYDLASVTKVTACLPVLLHLTSAGEVGWDDKVSRFFSNAGWMQEPSLGDVTVRELALHTSGLPAWRPLFAWVESRRAAVANVLQTPLSGTRGQYDYSDLGVIVLTAIAESVTGRRLDEVAEEVVFGPLGMASAGYGPFDGAGYWTTLAPTDGSRAEPAGFAPTERDPLRGQLVGRVHDENADCLAGVSGHAGLFGAAGDVARYAHAWLTGQAPFASAEAMAFATEDHSGGVGPKRGMLWRKSDGGWPFGDLTSAEAFGHTGYTGTSVLIDPSRGFAVVLLTNRVHPRRGTAEGIAALRRDVHAAVAEVYA